MLHHASKRLARAGFEVLGGWLSPGGPARGPAQAPPPAQGPLSEAFRLHTAALACEGDELVSASRWEATLGRAASPGEVVAALRAALNAEFQGASWVADVRIFVACLGEEVKQYQRITTGEKQGLVVVPRPDEDDQLEKTSSLMYVADPPLDRLTLLSDCKLRAAMNAGDRAFIIQSTTESLAQFLLEPSQEAKAEFAADFARLAPTPEGAWPSKKLMQRLATVQDNRYPAVLVATGAMSPAHRGHVLMMWEAKARLERCGYAVVGAWLSPGGAAAAAAHAQATGGPQLSWAFRHIAAELSVCDDDFVAVRSVEPPEPGGAAASAQELCREVQQYLSERFSASFEGQMVRVFLVCGTDVAEKSGLYSGVLPHRELGVVIVPREDEEPRLEVPSQLVYVADPIPGDACAFSSSRVRAAIREGSVAAASQEMAPAAARYVLAPTPAERREMSADYEALAVKSMGREELDQSMAKLKETLRAWAGPQGCVRQADLARLLHFIDPSWTEKEMNALMGSAKISPDGTLVTDEFIDWIFNHCQA
ncbi:unnamed protein product [Prorocentrum cordatum]|uniref:Cytidyltransferase-like domain-containing protein n=1 Tax=Prorocentrum cordatum TaxID=2364126 RepID=A0ABN9Y255_9DINO|nr:unnamed protein product [Polarella glacialis]